MRIPFSQRTQRRLLWLMLVIFMGWGWVSYRNLHATVPGRVYRVAQPTPADLAEFQNKWGIRSVVNLRGSWPKEAWYQAECDAIQSLGLVSVDITCYSYRLPPHQELKKLVDAFDRLPRPLLLHCRRGADRTGLAAAVYLFLHEGVSIAEAQKQLSLYYLHWPWAYGHQLPSLFDLFEDWCERHGCKATSASFRRYVESTPCLGIYGTRLAWRECPSENKPRLLQLRAQNLSELTWFDPAKPDQAVRGWYRLTESATARKRAGGTFLIPAKPIPPGEWLPFDVILPPAEPGQYVVEVDLTDEAGFRFAKMGIGEITHTFTVTPAVGGRPTPQPSRKR